MENETILKIEEWPLNIEEKINYMISLETNLTFILTTKNFCVYDKSKDSLTKYPIPPPSNKSIKLPSTEPDSNNIWSDKFGNHVIFKLDKVPYYFNNILSEKKKIKELILEIEDNKALEPFAVAFNNNNENLKSTDEIIFSDKYSCIYSLIINIESNGVTQKIKKVFDFRYILLKNENNAEKKIEYDYVNEELDEKLTDNKFDIDKDDKINDILLFVKEEKSGTGKKIMIKRDYFILAVTKRIIFQFEGKNSIFDVFNNIEDKDEFFKNCKVFPKKNSGLIKTKIQIHITYDKKSYFLFNSDLGLCFWKKVGSPLPIPQQEFNIINYAKRKKEGGYEKIKCPLSSCRTQKCIYYLYNDCLVVLNTLLKNIIIHVEYLDEEFISMYYSQEMNKLILYSNKKIVKISLEHENDNLWKDYVERGEYNLAIPNFTIEDSNLSANLHKIYADSLFKNKKYDLAGQEYALSNENFEHVCLQFSKLNDINPLINYLNFVNKYRLEDKKYFLQKYLINTWLFELLLQKDDIEKKTDGFRNILFESGYIDSKDYVDKRLILNDLFIYGRHDDYSDFAGIKNDYKAIIFDLVNHKNYQQSLSNIQLWLSSISDEEYQKKIMEIFLDFSNVFAKECPSETIDILDSYYYLIEEPNDIIRIISNININDKEVLDDDNYDKILEFIKKLMDLIKTNNFPKLNDKKNDSDKTEIIRNIYNLYILYLSISTSDKSSELLDYLKPLAISAGRSHNITNNNNKKIYLEFSLAKAILKERKSALALVY